jgi:hypothetical protein
VADHRECYPFSLNYSGESCVSYSGTLCQFHFYVCACQGWPTSTHRGPCNSLSTRLRAARVYMYIKAGGGGGRVKEGGGWINLARELVANCKLH